MPITVSIIEDDRDTRESLTALINREPKFRCLSAYANGETALQRLPVDKPQVALFDINLPGMSGIQCVAQLKHRMPELQILMLTTYEDRELIFNSLRAGASGYLLKNTPHTELFQAIEQVLAGGSPMSMHIARKVVNHFFQAERHASEVDKLTPREKEILSLLANGYLYKEIVEALGISMSTVNTHLQNIYAKLHVQSRAEAALKYLTRK
jgi:DNA-binding NarL/FixJ family response regulator